LRGTCRSGNSECVLPIDVRTYAQLVAALRARRDELQVTHEVLDAVSGLQPGWTSKLFCRQPMRRMGPLSLECMLGALGLKLTISEDPEALARVQPLLTKREVRDWRPRIAPCEEEEEQPWPSGMDFPSKELIRENVELRRQLRALQETRQAVPPLPPPKPRKPQRRKKARRGVRYRASRNRGPLLAAALG